MRQSEALGECPECGRSYPVGDENDAIDIAFRMGMHAAEPRLRDGVMLAGLWLRSPDQTTRRLGADLKQILDEAS